LLGLVLALVATGLGGSPASAVTRHECRVQWSDLTSLHGEDGNPDGPVPELTARWDTAYDGAAAFAESATASECGPLIDGYALEWDQLELFMYGLSPFDPLGRLAIAEGDRLHALHFQHIRHLSRPLERAFDRARKQAPLAAADLAPTMTGAPGIDVTDRPAVRAFLAQLGGVARRSRHEAKLDRALRLITDAELDEE
ncbi:MAG: hypothetical protein QOF53_1040, partial [Nocardioidaceae bacterium]|nr:hypothetical protein [Nocardioidaceae bacterium]